MHLMQVHLPSSFDEAKHFYFQLITTIVPGPASWSYFIPIVLLPLGLLVPSHVLSHAKVGSVVVPVSLAATVHAWIALGGTDVISTDCLYMVLFLYVFKDPRRDFRRVVRNRPVRSASGIGQGRCEGGGGGAVESKGLDEHAGKEYDGVVAVQDKGEEEVVVEEEVITLESYPKSLSGRAYWAMMLPQSRPMHDWLIGNASHDKKAMAPFRHPTRLHFTLDVLSRLLPVLLVLLPLSKYLALHDPAFHTAPTKHFFFAPYPTPRAHLYPHHHDSSSILPSQPPLLATLFQTYIPPFIGRPFTIAAYTYSLLHLLFLPPMLIPVILSSALLLLNHLTFFLPFLFPFSIPTNHAWSPHTWRPHFGPLSSIWNHGVRGFWGRWWHQQMRHVVSEPGRWIVNKFSPLFSSSSSTCSSPSSPPSSLSSGQRLRSANDSPKDKVKDTDRSIHSHAENNAKTKKHKKVREYMVICITAFLLSGITHAGMVPPRPQCVEEVNTTPFSTPTTISCAWKLRAWLASFFWIQPVGILLEMIAIEPILTWLGRVRGMRWMAGVVRIVWTLGWMCLASVLLVEPMWRLGYWHVIPEDWTPLVMITKMI